MEVDRGEERSTITIDSTPILLPFECSSYEEFEDILVCLLSIESPTSHAPDFGLPSLSRNIVGLRETGEHAWTVQPYPDPDDSRHYVRVYRFLDRCIARRWESGGSSNWVEADPRTGKIVEQYPLDTIRIDGDLRQFSRDISSFFNYQGIAFIIEDSDHGTRGNYITAFDETEDELWRRQFVSGLLMEKDDKLLSMHEPSMGANTDIQHDPMTGEPIAIYNSVFDSREMLVRALPESMHPLIDEYLDESGG